MNHLRRKYLGYDWLHSYSSLQRQIFLNFFFQFRAIQII